ncbi:MAG TPA: AzlD domain-containing protein [Oscillospiraceae bacterium]|nr:AzlD domain-containing protein [Oscillospiraceae bacterium]HRW56808.1 AzlD domain-containing protein [Oscillospiraceae bacterium]
MTKDLFLYIGVMALVTYLIRMLPLAVFRKKIRSRFILSFLHYVPYAVLGAMTIPGIFYSTGSAVTAFAGFMVASIMAYKNYALLPIACAACAAAWLTGLVF